ncbi:HAD family hydrolase [Armatimonas sp.]|uniref:HAD family hydrolase n=1 Tax=Armatimonas sp. TaxID=1872638 RepID=UPI003751D40E
MRCLKGIFFDLDDTLISTSVAMHAALLATLPLLPNQNIQTLAAALADSYQALWGYGTPGYASLKTILTPELRCLLTNEALSRLGIQDEDLTRAMMACYAQAERVALQPLPGVQETLEKLQPHFQLGVITNGPSHIQREKLAQVGLATYFSVVIADADFGAPKPDPHLFAYAAQQLGLRSCELMFVGDSPSADVAGANTSGWISVYLGKETCLEATFSICRFEELLQLPPLQETKRPCIPTQGRRY